MKINSVKHVSELAKQSAQSQPLTGLSTVSTAQGALGAEQIQAIKENVIKQFGPTVRRDGLLQITSLRRSKSYDLEKTDSTFPSGFKLHAGDNAPKYFLTIEVIEWVLARCNTFRNKQVGV